MGDSLAAAAGDRSGAAKYAVRESVHLAGTELRRELE
jgi:hypothetical protein